ncbi:MAG: M48 family metalloprotease [Rhodocyclales bacterium]|nr:M48 family metalloprotease [Rhodocyclales bacterium]
MKPLPRPAPKRSPFARLLPIAASVLLCACASTAPGGRPQFTAPSGISSLYSAVDMNLRLATAPSTAKDCEGVQCRVDKGFELQVARVGARLAKAAYEADPELKLRVPAFNFVVAEKNEAGSTSDAQGTVVIYRGVRKQGLDEETLAFLIAREMGHVIARHHDERSATTLLFSVVAQVLMPMTSLTGGFAALAGSLASAVGTKIVSDEQLPFQVVEAELIAHDLLQRQGWRNGEVAASLARYTQGLGDGPWAQAVKDSLERFENDETDVVLLALINPMALPSLNRVTR